jgi:hypothetical protein|tara:strand:- start:431 stop:895 length:465 start_codon:yes stop_codon:yes gene_type:complete
MSDEIDNVVDDLLTQLKNSKEVEKGVKDETLNLSKENLEDFLMQYSGKLIKGSVNYVEDVKQYITAAPDSRDLEALSKLVGASAAAIESLNKILITDKNNDVKKEIKVMDIESKKMLQDNQNEKLGLTINREELMKQLMKDATLIDADVTDLKE